MNESELSKGLTEADERFAARVRERLADETAALNAAQLSRLNQARHAALAELDTPRFGWLAGLSRLPLGAVGLTACLVLAVWLARPELNEPAVVQPGTKRAAAVALTAEEFEWVLADEDPAMLEELDFYAWLDEGLADGDVTGG